MQWINHRGIHTQGLCTEPEGSLGSFQYSLDHGWGLEFDLQMTSDQHFIVTHDTKLSTHTHTQKPLISDLTLDEIRMYDPQETRIPSLHEILNRIQKSKPGIIHAFHWKGSFQKPDIISAFKNQYSSFKEGLKRCIIFDLKVDTAETLKNLDSSLKLAPSVSHPYDIKRFYKTTHETLMSLDEVSQTHTLWDWVWLDEWDLQSENNDSKTLINQKTCDWARSHDFSIAAVSPELHATSSALLGGEHHPDGLQPQLEDRLMQIQSLSIDAICSDYCCYYQNKNIHHPQQSRRRALHA
ncbi:MAG: glycerophosphodiester phosphodiesterase family protein [Oligoflexales bacterium]